jgi:hypothetical protein
LRNKAVDELNKAKKFISDGESEGTERPKREWRTVWKERDCTTGWSKQEEVKKPDKVWKTAWKEKEGTKSVQSGWVDKEEVPKIMMMRVQSLDSLDDQRVNDIQQRGRLLDEEYNAVISTQEVDQQRLNRVQIECDQRPGKEGLIEALVDQIKFDNQMRKRYDEIYRRERNLRREATNFLRESRTRLSQIPEDQLLPPRMAIRVEELSRRE